VQSTGRDIAEAKNDLEMSIYYESARDLAARLTEWSKTLEGSKRRFVICTGGGPGIMEAANRGASEAHGINVGLNISLPSEQHHNHYITRELNFEFHYFFMRKFWFTYLAKAIIVFPGGFGTLDEFFENLTLVQTHKLRKPMPIVLFGTEFWDKTLNLKAMVDAGTISADWGGDVYLDEIHYYDHGAASAASLAAVASGQVDMIFEFDMPSLELASSLPDTTVYEARTAQTGCIRMRVTEKPFDDVRVRKAFVMAADNSVYPELVFRGRGDLGENHHVSPIHPEYAKLPAMKRDIEGAKKLLAEAGHGDGLTLTVDVGNTNGPWQQQCCEILKEQLAPAGINLNLNVMPSSKFWDIWDKTPLGLTAWTHRPLGTMVLSLAYRSGVPWNESAYNNPKFDAALNEAEALVDAKERSAKMAEVQRILQEDAIMVQPVWQPKFFVAHNKLKGLNAHPTQYHQFNQVWIDS
jgi:uncharacterized protein (TIGR00730 family)